MSTAPTDAFGSFLDKWLEAEPDAHLLRLFVPDAREPATAALLVLLHELETAAFGLDPQPAGAKLAWWQEELRRWVEGTPRHPITLALGAAASGRAVVELPARMARWLALDTVERFEQWHALAVELATAQERVFGAANDAADADPAPVLARILARFPRLAADPRGLLPLDVLAEAGATRAQLAAEPGGAVAGRVLESLAQRALGTPVAAVPSSELALARSHLARQALARMARGRAATPGIGTVIGLWRALRRYRARG